MILQQIESAMKNSKAFAIGMIFGGFIPLGVYFIAHHESCNFSNFHGIILSMIVVGGLIVSAKTVYDWSLMAYHDKAKAIGFVILLEGILVFSPLASLAWVSLGILAIINGVNAAVCITRKPKEKVALKGKLAIR